MVTFWCVKQTVFAINCYIFHPIQVMMGPNTKAFATKKPIVRCRNVADTYSLYRYGNVPATWDMIPRETEAAPCFCCSNESLKCSSNVSTTLHQRSTNLCYAVGTCLLLRTRAFQRCRNAAAASPQRQQLQRCIVGNELGYARLLLYFINIFW